MKSQKLEKLRKQFQKEWLLIAIDRMDESTTTPVQGRLLAHSPDPLDVHKAAQKSREPLLMTVYSNDWPEDIAACFHEHIPL
ncbi:MAG: hypothetical protein HYS08_03580 [Chlamydiae bacterium]|nr:hypothetical protein [Chlamydiota bacterium]MBI3266786.1 hypothetical protein [Chlamydiota bacterium]